MKLFAKIGFVLLLILGGAYFVYQNAVPEVTVQQVTRGTAVDTVSANVTVLSAAEIQIKSLESGYVIDNAFVPGTGALEVKKGDILCRLDTEMLDFEINKTKNWLNAAQDKLGIGSPQELDLENLEQDYAHNKKLFEIEQYPESELKKQARVIERLRRQIETQRIDLQTDLNFRKEHLAELELRKSRMTIASPVDGLLTEAYAFSGSYIYGGSPVGKIISPGVIIQISISEEDFPGVMLGQAVSVKFLGMREKTFYGKITNLVATADPNTRRRNAFVSLEDAPPGLLVAGMTGEASVTKAEREDTLIIPQRALLGRFVFVAEGEQVATREVKVGYKGLRLTEILEGLEEGDSVIVDNLEELRAGDRIHIVEE